MSNEPKSPTKLPSPRKVPAKKLSLGELHEGDSSFTVEVKVTSISRCREFGAGGEDNVLLHMTVIDEDGLWEIIGPFHSFIHSFHSFIHSFIHVLLCFFSQRSPGSVLWSDSTPSWRNCEGNDCMLPLFTLQWSINQQHVPRPTVSPGPNSETRNSASMRELAFLKLSGSTLSLNTSTCSQMSDRLWHRWKRQLSGWATILGTFPAATARKVVLRFAKNWVYYVHLFLVTDILYL